MTSSDNAAADDDDSAMFERGISTANGVMSRLFESCADDPKGSVHRAWGLSLLFVVVYFVISVIEMVNLQSLGGSKAMVVASIWTGMVHLMLGVLGTFVLKRFPTSFSVGFLLGVLIVLANQNLILFGTFHGYSYGTAHTNHTFANLGFALFLTLLFFSVLLFHFKKSIVVAPADTKGFATTGGAGGRGSSGAAGKNDESEYQKYDEGQGSS